MGEVFLMRDIDIDENLIRELMDIKEGSLIQRILIKAEMIRTTKAESLLLKGIEELTSIDNEIQEEVNAAVSMSDSYYYESGLIAGEKTETEKRLHYLRTCSDIIEILLSSISLSLL